MKALAVILVVLGTLFGCARAAVNEPSASPGPNPKLACERAGGEWRGLRGECEMP